MKHFFGAILFTHLIATHANSTVKPTKEAHFNVNNYNSFYAGPNCKKIEQQLEEIRQEIRALKENKTTESVNGKGLYIVLEMSKVDPGHQCRSPK